MMMKELVADFPKQLQKALLIAQSAQLNKSNTAIQNVFISGLGGSGIGGTIVAELVSQEATCPIVINKDYFSNCFINEKTQAIICTNSANTE
jgi:glucose/mannose-6-phosphate isomerase